MQFSDVLAKIAQNLRLSAEEIDFLRRMGDETQLRNQQVNGLINPAGQVTAANFSPLSGLMKVFGDIYAAGGDIRIDAITGQTEDGHLTFYIDGVRQGEVWYDRSTNNIVISNNNANGDIVFTANGTNQAKGIVLYDTLNALTKFYVTLEGSVGFYKRTTDPAYHDGYAAIYFYSNGAGTDELRVRAKIGAVETQVTLANLSP